MPRTTSWLVEHGEAGVSVSNDPRTPLRRPRVALPCRGTYRRGVLGTISTLALPVIDCSASSDAVPWIAAEIETYVAWLAGQGYSTKSVWRRVPIVFAFGSA